MSMSNVLELSSKKIGANYFGSATVVELAEQGVYRLCLTEHYENVEAFARLAIPSISALDKGEEVLVAGDSFSKLYIIGLLTNRASTEKVKACDGAYAVIGGDSSQSSVLQLFSKRNELIVEYDPESEKTRINVENGNLEFSTKNGDIVFDSAQNIQVNGQTIDLVARSGVRVGVANALGELASSLSIWQKKVKVSSAQIGVAAQQGEFQLKEARYVGGKFLGKVESSQLIVGKLSVVANSISEKANNIYRSVEQLTQLKTGRMRTLVESTFHMKSKKTFMKTEEDFKIKSDKIHLG